MKYLIVLLSSVLSIAASAAEPLPELKPPSGLVDPNTPGLPTLTPPPMSPRDLRAAARGFVLGNFSYIDLMIPAKFGVTAGLNSSGDNSWEIEYLRGSVSVPIILPDLGSMTDQRVSLIRRSYFGKGSFNFSYGVSYFDFTVHLGDKFISGLSGGNYPSADLVNLTSLGAYIGLGNRWVFKNGFTVGVDWFSYSQPIFLLKNQSAFLDYASNQNDKDNVSTLINLLSGFPRFAALKVQMGFLF